MKFFKAAALLCAGVASTYALATPAHAASSITVDYPNGDEYASGAEVIVSGTNNSVNTETLSVECDNSSRYPQVDVAPGPFSVSVGSFTGPDTCRIYDYDYNQLAMFTVAAPPTSVSDASVSRDTFYPFVRDGYQDDVMFRWRQERGARASISVVNADGRTVRTATPYVYRGRNNWSWNGKKDNGDLVARGGTGSG